MTDDILDDLPLELREWFMVYHELYRRRQTTHAWKNGYYGQELPERVKLEVFNELTEQLRLAMPQLTDDQHRFLKLTQFRLIFGARKVQWVKK